MIITELIREQAFQCAVMAGAGVFVMTAYCVFRNTCSLLGLSEKTVNAMELIFWVAAAAAASHFLYYCAYGRLSFHAAIAFTAGALLWKKFFCDIIDKLYTHICMKQGINNKHGEKEKKQSVQRHKSGN